MKHIKFFLCFLLGLMSFGHICAMDPDDRQDQNWGDLYSRKYSSEERRATFDLDENPYTTLGVDRDATEADIKKAYHKLVLVHHPDKGGDAEMFKQVKLAYDMLMDPVRRERVDRLLGQPAAAAVAPEPEAGGAGAAADPARETSGQLFNALVAAIKAGDTDTFSRRFERLRERFERMIVMDAMEMTLLHWAVMHGRFEIARMLFTANRTTATHPDRIGRTPLHWAARHGRMEMIDLLCSYRTAEESGLNLLDANRYTPLDLAVRENHRHVVRRLLELGANITLLSVMLAIERGSVDILALLLKPRGILGLRAAVDLNRHFYGVTGRTPLTEAVVRGYSRMVRLLLAHGADVSFAMLDGNTPLHIAAQAGHEGIVQILLAAGANPVAENTAGQTPIDLAANPAIVILLTAYQPQQEQTWGQWFTEGAAAFVGGGVGGGSSEADTYGAEWRPNPSSPDDELRRAADRAMKKRHDQGGPSAGPRDDDDDDWEKI